MIPLVDAPLEDYAARHSLAPSELLDEIEAYTLEHCADAQMLVGRVEGALLRLLIQLAGVRRVLEIGLFTGYSALSMAEVLPPDGELVSCEIEPANAVLARSFLDRSPHGAKIRIAVGPALSTLPDLPGPFDLVFLDADKENYPDYYRQVVPLLADGGLLVADNALWSGGVLAPASEAARAIAEFNGLVQADPRLENVLLTVRDGMMLARKRPAAPGP